jgi:predicted MFS family arabinose efflux permease
LLRCVLPLRVQSSESLAFLAPSFALTVAGRAFEGFPCPRGALGLPRGP